MRPAETAVRYDQLARWCQEYVPATYVLAALEAALAQRGGSPMPAAGGRK